MWLLVIDVQLCSIGSVYLSKYLLDNSGDGHFTIAALQLLIKWLLLELVVQTGYFKLAPKQVGLLQRTHTTGMMTAALGYALTHVAGLMSLGDNSLLLDQTTKMAMVPATVLFQLFVRGNPIPLYSWTALAATLSGCVLYFTADVNATGIGGVVCVAYFIIRTFYDFCVMEKDDEYEPPSGSTYRIEPLSAAMLFVAAPLTEPNWYDIATSWTTLLLVTLGSMAHLFAHIGMIAIVERANVAAVSIFFCVLKLFLFVIIECIIIGRTTIVAEQAMGMLLVMVGLMATLNFVTAHCLLIIGTIYITVIANGSFLSPFHFT